MAMQVQCGYFTVQNFDGTEVGPTIGLEDSKAFSVAGMGEPASSAVSISSPGSVSILSTSLHLQIQWAVPPMGAAEDSEGVPLRCRTVLVLLNLTDEVQEVELSGLCWWQLKS